MAILPSRERDPQSRTLAWRAAHCLWTSFCFRAGVSSCLLLILVMGSWRASTGVPVRAPSVEVCQRCSSLFRNLLRNIDELQKSVGPTLSSFFLRFSITPNQELRLCSRFPHDRKICASASRPAACWWAARVTPSWRAHPTWPRWPLMMPVFLFKINVQIKLRR